MIESIDPAAREMYLAHIEPGMKRAHAERDWGRLERALMEMETQLKDILRDDGTARVSEPEISEK